MKTRRFSLVMGFLAMLIFVVVSLLAQKVSTKATVVTEIFLTDSGLIPLPKDAVELEPALSIRSEYFRSSLKLALGSNGNLFASSLTGNIIAEFGLTGEPRSAWGEKRGEKNLLRSPFYIAAAQDFLVVYETDQSRTPPRYGLHIIDYRGKSLRRVEIPRCTDIECDAEGSIYLAPYMESRETRLVSVLRPDGSTHSFGEPLPGVRGIPNLNSRSLALNDNGEIFVAFTYFPIVRKYSRDGLLLGEYRIDTPIYSAKENFNKTIVSEEAADSENQSGALLDIISEIKCLGDKIYFLSCIPRLEIAELDKNGNLLTTYWFDTQVVYRASDFAVAEKDGEIHFFVSHSFSPKYEIDVFRRTRNVFSDGVQGEIDKQTAEIAANPDHYLAWHNRGVAKYQLGDFSGAIEDLNKAIELAPDSALAHLNLGLAKVKTKEFESAVRYFTRAIELKPAAAAFYDRGIAWAHMKEYKRAIDDFEKAAEMDMSLWEKAILQIDYCRKRLKSELILDEKR